jgi:site-specific DNA recombinase
MMTMARPKRRVAIYERVSSDDQRERETIKTQTAVLDARVAAEPDVEVVARYSDDGVSGTKRLRDRPSGARLLGDAAAGRFDELWIYRIDRLGRNLADMAETGQHLERLGVRLVSATEGTPDPFMYDILMYDILSALAQNELRTLRRRLGDGANRAAEEARYPSGVVAYGYRVTGEKKTGRLVPDESEITAGLTAAGLIRQIFHWVGVDGWSCVRVAHELNLRHVPTYAASGRGRRTERTQELWRHGRIGSMIRNPIYKGCQVFGRRNGRATSRPRLPRPLVTASIEPLVSQQLWEAAQETMTRNRTIARNTKRAYLLRGVIRCAACSLTYVGSQGREGVSWYRCGGRDRDRGPLDGKCRNPMLRGEMIDLAVWADIEAWLRNPGHVLADLENEFEHESEAAISAAALITLRRAMDGLEAQRERVLGLAIRGHLSEGDADAELDRISGEQVALRSRVSALEAPRGLDVPESAQTTSSR